MGLEWVVDARHREATGMGPMVGTRVFRVMSSVRTGLWFVPVMCVLAGVVLSFATIAVDRALRLRARAGGAHRWSRRRPRHPVDRGRLDGVAHRAGADRSRWSWCSWRWASSHRASSRRSCRTSRARSRSGCSSPPSPTRCWPCARCSFEDGGQVPGSGDRGRVRAHRAGEHRGAGAVRAPHRPVAAGGFAHRAGRLRDARAPRRAAIPTAVEAAADEPRRCIVAPRVRGRVAHRLRPAGPGSPGAATACSSWCPALGEFVPAGAPLFRIEGERSRLDHGHVGPRSWPRRSSARSTRTSAYGFRLLVDIAERSLADSPFLDPTTAVQAIDRLHDCLRQLVLPPVPGRHATVTPKARCGSSSRPWTGTPTSTSRSTRSGWPAHGSPQVARRLRRCAGRPDHHRPARPRTGAGGPSRAPGRVECPRPRGAVRRAHVRGARSARDGNCDEPQLTERRPEPLLLTGYEGWDPTRRGKSRGC